MAPQTDSDYKNLLTEVIKKQIVILGPDITLAKARNVAGLSIADDGTVLAFTGNPQEVTQKLIDQFMELSGMIVKKTMEPLLAAQASAVMPVVAIPTIQPIAPAPAAPAPQAVQPVQPTQTNITGGTA